DYRQHRHCHIPVSFPFGADSDSDATHRRNRSLHTDVLPECQFEHHVTWRISTRNWRARGCGHRYGRKRVSATFGTSIERISPAKRIPKATHFARFGQTGWPCYFLFIGHHCGFLPASVLAGGSGRTNVSSLGLDENAGSRFFFGPGYHACASSDDSFHPWTAPPRI